MPTPFVEDGVKGVLYTERLFDPDAPIDRWAERFRRSWQDLARAEAPVNERANKGTPIGPKDGPRGNLVRRIGMSKTRLGPNEIEIEGRSGAPYSVFVIQGTGSGIISGWRTLPPNFGWKRKSLKPGSFIRGIEHGNDFMNEGLNRAWDEVGL